MRQYEMFNMKIIQIRLFLSQFVFEEGGRKVLDAQYN